MTFTAPLARRLTPLAALALRLSLCLALVLAGAWGAAACAAQAGLQPMEICSDAGARDVIWLDAEGHAAPAPGAVDCDACPDCLAAAAGAVVPRPAPLADAADTRFDPLWMTARAEMPARPDPVPAARGPPCAAPVRMIS
ncbi:hypothetical protein FBT96_09415 [Rhodobacter capsulatus]|uniref:DUF2946 domain-containing protein n=1 Tax=Rhodobacter capsulatus TaxID=1061 RepID=A0A4U1JQX5_RHOCA|nr:hypothetical protein [Rhodobacter capsulatus]TKD21374.1 hypothetical protein FBT96_09415 [Rhodobacter capsulatus]